MFYTATLFKLFVFSVTFAVFSIGGFLGAFETINPGVLRVAVTDILHEGENAPGWTLGFLREVEKAYDVDVEFVVVACFR